VFFHSKANHKNELNKLIVEINELRNDLKKIKIELDESKLLNKNLELKLKESQEFVLYLNEENQEEGPRRKIEN
jgi:hypothetical protein